MKWLNFSTIFSKEAKMKEEIQSLELSVQASQLQIENLIAEKKSLQLKADALDRLKKVFIDEGDKFFFAANTTKNRFAFVTLDKHFHEIKIWGEYTNTDFQRFEEDCKLVYKFKIWDDEKSLQIVEIISKTKKQGYATLAIEALSRIAYIHDLKLIVMKVPENFESDEIINTCSKMGFKIDVGEDQIICKFYKEI